MKAFHFSLLVFSFSLHGIMWGQKGIDGPLTVSSNIIVNEYTALTANASAGNTSITVANSNLNTHNRFASALSAGDLVMIIQMQGATINGRDSSMPNLGTPNDSSWGAILNYNNCGNYEFKQVASVPNATTITFNCPIRYNYTASGKVQIVRIPRYTTLTINNGGNISCDVWDSAVGGIAAIEVENNTTINTGGSINVSGNGFRGGFLINQGAILTGLSYETSNISIGYGALKGEGIAGNWNDYNLYGGAAGLGAPANGGGGGDDENAGGGGGANGGNLSGWIDGFGVPDVSNPNYITAWNLEYSWMSSIQRSGGGRGGYTWCFGSLNPLTARPGNAGWLGDDRRSVGGRGGRPLDYTTGRIFMGGGGGAGQENNNQGGGGGNGGGIVYLLSYGTVTGGGQIITNGANGGNNVANSAGDGAGGAGSGGTIIISSTGNISGITLQANGGIGGSQLINSVEADGTGGGGGGGYIGTTNAGITSSVNDGAYGTTTSSPMTSFPPNGATSGNIGTINSAFIPVSDNCCSLTALKISASKDSICLNDTITISVTAIGSNTVKYKWSPGGQTRDTIHLKPGSTTKYYVTVTDTTGINCLLKDSITITVHPNISISLNGNDTICAGNSTTLTASGGTIYSWSNGATTSSISPTPVSNTTYTVKVSNGFCSKDTSAEVVVKTAPNLSINSSGNTICSGDSVTLSVSGADNYVWTPSAGLSCTTCPNPTAKPKISTTYIVTGYDNDGCASSKSITILVETAPVLAAIPNQIICSGNSVTFVANIISGFGGTFTWEPGGSTGASISVSPAVTTTYTLQYSNACGITTTDVTIFVTPAPLPDFITDITQGCAPFCTQFRDLSTIPSGKIASWSWKFGNGDSSNLENPLYCYPNPGSYSPMLTVTSIDGCSATLKILQMITVFSHPVAKFIDSPQPTTILEPTIKFTDKSTDVYGIAYWFWTFGDYDSVNNLQNPIHTYQDTGIYCPKLVVMNIKGCFDTIVNCIVIDPIFALYIPSAFSPNGDGLNEIFTAKGDYIKSFEMYIFDRWGMELYHTTDINRGWNGIVTGGNVICQEDSYVYTIMATDWRNQKHSYIGEVTLIK